jgi:hypothetical protein
MGLQVQKWEVIFLRTLRNDWTGVYPYRTAKPQQSETSSAGIYPAARFMRIQDWITRIGHLFIGLDKNILAKIIQLTLLGDINLARKSANVGLSGPGMLTRSNRARVNQ